ncbi:glycoside hydrolase superfamily [Lactarius akahatsu]|uniref:Glycoside hydrolase superfamily n=1 Tax=Lactarius akahatsu TaxID=416441 RepID=A0AAD4L391_9AGAM|nr:glycoside hydrolase superfamily [Lactarius akahatsu]
MSSLSIDSSFVLVGTEQSQVLPSRPPTATSDGTFPSSISTPTSPIDSNASSVGTLEPVNHPSSDPAYVVGSSSSYAHDWSRDTTGGIRTHGRHFIDGYGRVCNLRGVNLSGNCKTPVNGDHTTFPAGAETVTFVGRPFPLEEAPQHLARLRRWGLTFVRFLITWEAVEHEGPGIYDTPYLSYLRSVLSLLPQYGLTAFVALHQDVWSRYAGGSGAPAWTLEHVGFDLRALEESGAAWLRGVCGGGHTEAERGLWPCGYQKLAAATMATCFWAGDTFAPKLRVRDGVPVQHFLQDAFLDMWEAVARAVGDLDGVLGFEMMNEPHRGYVDLPSLHGFDYNTDLHLGDVPSAFQSFLLGAGYPTNVNRWTRSFPMPTRRTGRTLLNPHGRKAWREDGPTGGRDLWEMHGVWKWNGEKNAGAVLVESYFVNDPATGRKVDWYTDFYYPLLKRWTARVRGAVANGRGHEKVFFVEPVPNEFCPPSWTSEHQLPNMVFAPHWYDLRVLFDKAHGEFSVNVQALARGANPIKTFHWGQKGARNNFATQIRSIVEAGYRSLGERPVLIGECGVPMDMNGRAAFKSDNWTWQRRMMDAMITGLERANVGFTLWNYNPDNDDTRGDDWNGENFSWFSNSRAPRSALAQDADELDAGARILDAVVRPYAAKTAGVPLRFEYEPATGAFTYSWAVLPTGLGEEDRESGVGGLPSVHAPPLTGHAPPLARETEIFVPARLARGRRLIVDGLVDGDAYTYDAARQTLFVLPAAQSSDDGSGARAQTRTVRVRFDPPVGGELPNDFRGDFGGAVGAVSVVLLALVAYYLIGRI